MTYVNNSPVTKILNSDTLTSSGVYTTDVLDLDSHQFLETELYSDQNGSLVGEWLDEDTQSIVIRTFTLPYSSSIGLSFTATPIFSRYLRYTYTNGDTDQTSFQIKVKVSNIPYSGQMLQVDQFIPSNVLSQLTRSVIVGVNSENVYKNVGVNDIGALNTSNFLLDVARGNYPTYKIGTKFGRNSDIDSGPEDVWNGGNDYTGFNATAAQTVTIISASAADTTAGTGARTIQLDGLDADYNEISEVVTLTGIVSTTSVNSYLRLARAKIITAGTTGTNAGEITIRQSTTTANIFAVIPVLSGQTAIACDTVPAGKTRIITNLYAAMTRSNGSAGSANMNLQVRELGGAWQTKRSIEVANGQDYNPNTNSDLLISEKADIRWRCQSVSDSGSILTGQFEYIDIDE